MNPQIFSTLVTRRSSLIALAVATTVTGCAPQLQTQIIGRTNTVAGPPTAAAQVVAAEIPVPESHSAQVLRYVVALPRAVQLHYQVTCPSAEREGTVGETFDSYRTRRLAELERERQAQARLIGSLVGAVAPPVRASAGVAGPGGSATAVGEINPGAAATDVARDALPPATLPPGDTGATVVRGTVELGASAAGRCALTLAADPIAQDATGTQVLLELVRLVDVEAEERARLAAIRAEQDKSARGLRVWLLGSLQRAGADPMARERARATAQARAEEENRRRVAAAEEESRRRQAAAEEENRRRQEAAEAENRRRQEMAWRAEQERLRLEQERLRREQQAAAERERREAPERERRAAAERERLRLEQERIERERQAAAERERREAPERERRAAAERDRLARLEAERQARLAKDEAERLARLAKEEAERQARLAKEAADRQARLSAEAEARAKADREVAERRAREWRARQAAIALRWQLYARFVHLGADPRNRERLEEARIAARLEEQRRTYEARAKRELDVVVARRTAIDLRFNMVTRLRSMGADPEYRRHRDEAMFREMDAQARSLQTARTEAAERVRWETQAAIDLRVLAKVRLRQVGAVDRPTCPPPPAETPPPAPFAGATWIEGRYSWNGIAWIWGSGHYERPPEVGTVWVPPAQIAVSGTLVVRPGRWVRISIGVPGAPR